MKQEFGLGQEVKTKAQARQALKEGVGIYSMRRMPGYQLPGARGGSPGRLGRAAVKEVSLGRKPTRRCFHPSLPAGKH